MTNEELNTALYQKMFNEQSQYRDQLRTMTPEEILGQAYEFVCREDILLSLEYNDLSTKQAEALLKSDTPLADVFKKWESWETSHMDDVWSAVAAQANEMIRADFIASRREDR